MWQFAASTLVAVLLLGTAAAGPLNDLAIFGYDPSPNSEAVTVSDDGKARFTVLTPHVVRAEYSASGAFEDRATLVAVNRRLPVPPILRSSTGGVLTLRIPSTNVSVTYINGRGGFTAQTLSGVSANGAAWRYGDADYGNLLGTVKSLDTLCTVSLNCTKNAGIRVYDESLHCAWGVVSRGGWTVIDDTKNYIMSAEPNAWFSNTDRSVSDSDLYFFAHGLDYKQALKDFSLIAGKQQIVSRPLLGSWYTRWYDFDQTDLTRLVDLYEKTSLPLDVLVLDMNWHKKNDWTGYSWDRQVFPHPEDVLEYAKDKGLMIAANLHDAHGIGSWEDKYKQMCTAVGQLPSGKSVPFQPMNGTYMHALEDIVLANAGFDFYWIDWQQGGPVYGCAGERMNPTFITDHVRGTDGIRTKSYQRSNVLARFGGLGSHRYPVGFSGDVASLSWECFAFQPYFSATAANVLYGSVSHDLVGPAHDHELHVRWMQFGAFSGIMRIHDRGMSAGSCWPDCPLVNMWRLPIPYLDAVRAAMTARVALLPYFYTETHKGYHSGVSVVRGLYIDFPQEPGAYRMTPKGSSQYMFGDVITVAPVTEAADATTGLVQQQVWCPPGQWFDEVYGELVTGPRMLSRSFVLGDVPRLVRAGAIVPTLPSASAKTVGIATKDYESLDVLIYPGLNSGSYTMTEDDGRTYNYTSGLVANTVLSYTTSENTVTVKVAPPTGPYASSLPSTRRIRVVFVAGTPVQSATVTTAAESKSVAFRRFPGRPMTWTYDAETANTIVDAGDAATAAGCTVAVSFTLRDTRAVRRDRLYAQRSALAKRTLDNTRETPDSTSVGPGFFKIAASTAGALAHAAGTSGSAFETLLAGYTKAMQRGLDEVEGQAVELIQLYDAERLDNCLCGSAACRSANSYYYTLWVEGYQPAHRGPNVVALRDYWSSQALDNWGTIDPVTPAGYTPATFGNGFVLKTAEAGTRCLKVWFNAAMPDHMTTGSAQGDRHAEGHGYKLVSNCSGYVYETIGAMREGKRRAQVKGLGKSDAAFQKAIALMESALSK